MTWRWGWLPKDPPAHFGDNFAFDVLRLLVVLAACFLAFSCLRVVREQRRRSQPFPRGQAFRFISLGLADVYVCLTEMAVFGTVATPRLLVGIAVNATGWYGIRSMRRKQLAEPVVR